MPQVVVLGDINIDVILPVSAYPQTGGEIVSQGGLTSLGGSAANTAVVLAKLGLATRLLGRVGQDAWGEIALGELRVAGVELDHVQRDAQAPTGMIFTPVTPDGERTMFGQRGANMSTDPAEMRPNLLAGAQLLHLSGYAFLAEPQRQAGIRAVELARRQGLALSLDTALLPALAVPEQIKALLPGLAICVLGLEEARALTGSQAPGECAQALLQAGVGQVGLKLGREGCLLAEAGGLWEIPAFPAQVVDTTGAGDAFSAGLIYARLHSLSPPAAGLLANALGGLAAHNLGAGLALPGKSEAMDFLQTSLPGADDEQEMRIIEVLEVIK